MDPSSPISRTIVHAPSDRLPKQQNFTVMFTAEAKSEEEGGTGGADAAGRDTADANARQQQQQEQQQQYQEHRKSRLASSVAGTTRATKAAISHAHHKTKNARASVAHHTKEVAHKTKEVAHKTKQVVETNVWCLPLKWCIHFPRNWPRTYAFFFGVCVPLWFLIFASMGFGIKLAQFESAPEVESNDAIMAARATIDYYDVTALRLLNVTTVCLAVWEATVLNSQVEADIGNDIEMILSGGSGDDDSIANITVTNDTSAVLDQLQNETNFEDLIDYIGEAFQNQTSPDDAPNEMVLINRTLLGESMTQCTQSYIPQIQQFQQVQANNSIAFDSLTFNWNRCWNYSSTWIFHPTQEQIVAANPSSQEAYFQQEWEASQQALYLQYLPENRPATPDEEYAAFLQSVQEATGGGTCYENIGGTAWFFFTIMTTVGYGNQAPVTEAGRLLVAGAGLFSLILFASVLGVCGYVLLAVTDDFVGRFWFSKFMTHPFAGVILWGAIWIVFATMIATDVEFWWESRLPEYALGIDRGDSLWFAFISTSTIGLGDYYLQPEVIFTSDTLKFSLLFMIGFVFLSTFFGKMAESLSYIMPKQHNSLEARLAATRIIACWPRGWMPWEEKPVASDPTEIADMGADDQALIYRMEELKKLKPDPPTKQDGQEFEDDENEEDFDRSLISQYTGNPIHSMNYELLQQEEALLKEWLAVVQHQQQRALRMRARQQEASLNHHVLEDVVEELAVIHEFKNSKNDSCSHSTKAAVPDQASAMSNSTSNSDSADKKTKQEHAEPAPVAAAARTHDQDDDEDDNQTVVTSAEETFNPLATFFSSA